MDRLTPVPVAEFDKQWPFYEECLNRVKLLRGGSWQPRHVFAAVWSGEAHVYAVPEGFLIFKSKVDSYDHTRILLVWMAYGEGSVDLFAKYEDQVVDLAKSHGYDGIEFYRAPCAAVREKQSAEGWHRAYSIYRRDLGG